MTTDDLDAATRAAFNHRYRDRIGHRFDAQPWEVQKRWTLICAKVLNGDIHDGKTFRAKYLEDLGAWDRNTDKEWHELSRHDRHEWDQVCRIVASYGAPERMAA